MNKPKVCIVGGGMITQVQILPSVYQLQRLGLVGDISVCALNSEPLKIIDDDETLKKAFPGQSFTAYPAVDTDPNKKFPDMYKKLFAELPQQSIVIIALPGRHGRQPLQGIAFVQFHSQAFGRCDDLSQFL